jgi:hypothetical protein
VVTSGLHIISHLYGIISSSNLLTSYRTYQPDSLYVWQCHNWTNYSESQYVKKWTATIFLYDTKTSVHCCHLEYTNNNKYTTPEVPILCLRYSCIPVIITYSSKHFKRLTRGVHEEPITDLFQTLWGYKFTNWRTSNNFFLSHFQTSLRMLLIAASSPSTIVRPFGVGVMPKD